MFSFFKKKIKKVNKESFQSIVKNIYNNISKTHSHTKYTIIEMINKTSPKDKFGNKTFIGVPLYEAIYGYQITCLIGFTSQQGLISIMDNLELKKILLSEISKQTGYNSNSIKEYDQSFLDCAGDIDCLNKKFSGYVFSICSINKSTENSKILDEGLKHLATITAINTQKNTALAFGAEKLHDDLNEVLEKINK